MKKSKITIFYNFTTDNKTKTYQFEYIPDGIFAKIFLKIHLPKMKKFLANKMNKFLYKNYDAEQTTDYILEALAKPLRRSLFRNFIDVAIDKDWGCEIE